jgi:hypothetical protein
MKEEDPKKLLRRRPEQLFASKAVNSNDKAKILDFTAILGDFTLHMEIVSKREIRVKMFLDFTPFSHRTSLLRQINSQG